MEFLPLKILKQLQNRNGHMLGSKIPISGREPASKKDCRGGGPWSGPSICGRQPRTASWIEAGFGPDTEFGTQLPSIKNRDASLDKQSWRHKLANKVVSQVRYKDVTQTLQGRYTDDTRTDVTRRL